MTNQKIGEITLTVKQIAELARCTGWELLGTPLRVNRDELDEQITVTEYRDAVKIGNADNDEFTSHRFIAIYPECDDAGAWPLDSHIIMEGETPIREIENHPMLAHGFVANARANREGAAFDLTHQGDVPASVHAEGRTNVIDEAPVDNRTPLKYAETHARNRLFAYTVMPHSLIINRGGGLTITNELDGNTLITLLDDLINQFGNESFPLDNSVNPQDNRELGLGTAIATTFNETHGFAQVASQLSVLLCDTGVFTRNLRPGQIYGNRYRVNNNHLPESWDELREWLENLPDNSHLAPDNNPLGDAV